MLELNCVNELMRLLLDMRALEIKEAQRIRQAIDSVIHQHHEEL